MDYVLVTGASKGIGKEFAYQLSAQGYGVILVARSKDLLSRIKDDLPDAYAIVADITRPGAAKRIHDGLLEKGIRIRGLINNAGFGVSGAFDEIGQSEYHEMIALNICAVTDFAYEFITEIEQQEGFVINVSSLAGFIPLPGMAVYAATKAYIISLSESLYAEYADKVRVYALCPGYTESEFHARAGTLDKLERMPYASAQSVVQEALVAIKRDAPVAIPGRRNRFLIGMSHLFSRRALARIIRRVHP